MNQKILTIQDLSCVGQCSLTVALPILSSYGIETCVLPTAILSNHTMFKTWSYLDLTPEIDRIFNEWETNNFKFDAFLLGYLGKVSLMEICKQCFERFSYADSQIIIDPVFGDNGKLYPGFNLEYVEKMKDLLSKAQIILPNLTEACFLTNIDYQANYDHAYVENVALALSKITSGVIIITGIEFDDMIGELIYREGYIEYVMLEKLPEKYHGTGDIFSSVFTVHYLSQNSLKESCNAAGKFVAECIRKTNKEHHFYGVNFEKILNRK